MPSSRRSDPHALEDRQGPSASEAVTDSSLRTSASRVLIRDSAGYLCAENPLIFLDAVLLDVAADHEFGRPLDYSDPVGERATWNVLVASTLEDRGRP